MGVEGRTGRNLVNLSGKVDRTTNPLRTVSNTIQFLPHLYSFPGGARASPDLAGLRLFPSSRLFPPQSSSRGPARLVTLPVRTPPSMAVFWTASTVTETGSNTMPSPMPGAQVQRAPKDDKASDQSGHTASVSSSRLRTGDERQRPPHRSQTRSQ